MWNQCMSTSVLLPLMLSVFIYLLYTFLDGWCKIWQFLSWHLALLSAECHLPSFHSGACGCVSETGWCPVNQICISLSVSANGWKMVPRACFHGQRWLNLQRSDSLMWTQAEANSADRQENFWQCLCFLRPLEPTRNLTFLPGNVKYFPISCFFTILSFSLHFIFHSDKIYQQWMHRS